MFFQGVNILTVVTPADDYDLVDLATLKADLNVTTTADDAYLARRITSYSASVSNYCNRVFPVEGLSWQFFPARDVHPWTVTEDIQPLQLPRWPIVTITSVVETIAGTATTLVSGTDYLADMTRGQLTRLDINGNPRRWHANPVAAVFAAGYATTEAPYTGAATLPADVFEATELLIRDAYYARLRDGALKSESIPGVISSSYATPNDDGMSAAVTAKLRNYRVPVIV